MMRRLTKMERSLLKITKNQAAHIESLWVDGRALVHPYTWARKGRSLEGTGGKIFARVLTDLGMGERDVEYGHDRGQAPRGGVEGKYVRLTGNGFRKIKRLLEDAQDQ